MEAKRAETFKYFDSGLTKEALTKVDEVRATIIKHYDETMKKLAKAAGIKQRFAISANVTDLVNAVVFTVSGATRFLAKGIEAKVVEEWKKNRVGLTVFACMCELPTVFDSWDTLDTAFSKGQSKYKTADFSKETGLNKETYSVAKFREYIAKV